MILKRLLRGLHTRLLNRHTSVFARYRATENYRRTRQNRRTIAVQPGIELEIYWKDTLPFGQGVTCSVVAGGEEVLRLDCFEQGRGHLHADFFVPNPSGTARLFFPEQSFELQLDRSVFELKTNLNYYLSRSPWLPARAVQLDPGRVAFAADQARALMLDFQAARITKLAPG